MLEGVKFSWRPVFLPVMGLFLFSVLFSFPFLVLLSSFSLLSSWFYIFNILLPSCSFLALVFQLRIRNSGFSPISNLEAGKCRVCSPCK